MSWKFKLDDRVLYTGQSCKTDGGELFKGMLGKVIQVTATHGTDFYNEYTVRFETGKGNVEARIHESNLVLFDGRYPKDFLWPDAWKERFKDAPAPNFKVGDRVRQNALTGTVVSINFSYDIELDGGGICTSEPAEGWKPHAPGKRERMAETLDLCRKFIAAELLCAGRLPHPIMRQIDEILAMPEDAP